MAVTKVSNRPTKRIITNNTKSSISWAEVQCSKSFVIVEIFIVGANASQTEYTRFIYLGPIVLNMSVFMLNLP